jgi:hypothetical protein
LFAGIWGTCRRCKEQAIKEGNNYLADQRQRQFYFIEVIEYI